MVKWWAFKIAKFITLAVVLIFVVGFVIQHLWNALIPELFNGPIISYWQAMGLLILSHILFRGPGGMHHGGWRSHHWKNRFEEKLAAMTPEEREKFKAEYRRRCGWMHDEKKEE